MTMTLKTITFAAAVSLLAFVAGNTQAASFDHIDRLATSLERQANLLRGEFGEHYDHSPYYRHLNYDAQQMQRYARHIHDSVHQGASIYHLQADLKQLDALFHHIERVLAVIEGNAQIGVGHIHGHTGHVAQEMETLEDTLHHLKADIDEMVHDADFHHDHFHNDFGGDQFDVHGHSH